MSDPVIAFLIVMASENYLCLDLLCWGAMRDSIAPIVCDFERCLVDSGKFSLLPEINDLFELLTAFIRVSQPRLIR